MNSKDRKILIKKIEKYYSEHKGKSLYFYPLAVLYSQENENEKAYQILLEGLQYYPRYVLALLKIAEILLKENKYEAALAYLETATSIQKYNTKALENLALAYEKLGKYEQAMWIYEKILSIDSNNEKSKSKIVELASFVKPNTDKIEDLLEDVNGKVDLETENIEEETKTAEEDNINFKTKDDSKSEIEIEKVPNIDLDGSETEEAEEPDDAASVTLARLYEKQGYTEDAKAIYKKILEKEPDNVEVQQALLKLESMERKNEENS